MKKPKPCIQGSTLTFDITCHYGKYALKFTFHRKKLSFPKLKEAYFSLAIVTNKLWEPLSSKSTSSRSYFSYDVVVDN